MHQIAAIKQGARYMDGINEIIYNSKEQKFYHQNVFTGKWKEKTEQDVTYIIQTHNELLAEFMSK